MSKPLVCAFGEPWLGPHPLCAAETSRVCGVPVSEVPIPDYSRYAVWLQLPLLGLIALLSTGCVSSLAPSPAIGTCKWRDDQVKHYLDAGGVWPTIITLSDGHQVYIGSVVYPGGPGTTWHMDENEDYPNRWCQW